MAEPTQDNLRIMVQVQDEVRQIHDAQRATLIALDVMASDVAGLFYNLFSGLVERELLDPDDPAVVKGRKLIDSLHKVKESIGRYQDILVHDHRVSCPKCQAALKTLPGEKVTRCQWCGTEFQESERGGQSS